ncbi:MAG: DUF3788 family protein [Bacteroidetes bacterium]|nr:DUF3788 family protein [Bacteroidota bacterium]
MLKPVLNDIKVSPDTDVLNKYLGRSINAWNSFIDLLKSQYPSISAEWRYYNDGKSWLFKVTKKAKTLCWVSVWQKHFKVTFYFNHKARDIIRKSHLDAGIKKEWLKNYRNKSIQPITIEARNKAVLKTIKLLIDLKDSMK